MEAEARVASRNAQLADKLAARGARTGLSSGLRKSGRLIRVVGLTLEARGITVSMGTPCEVETDGSGSIEAEVVGFEGDRIFLMPRGPIGRLRGRVGPRAGTMRGPGDVAEWSKALPC